MGVLQNTLHALVGVLVLHSLWLHISTHPPLLHTQDVQLYYFPNRGRAEAIRLLLHHAEVPFTDMRIPGKEFASKWKSNDALFPMGQMPALVVDGESLVQTSAIMRFVARHTGMAGSSAAEEVRADMLYGCIDDVRTHYARLVYSADFAAKRDAYVTGTLPADLAKLQRLLEENRGGEGFLVGASFTYPDAYLFEVLDVVQRLDAHALDAFPALAGFHARVAALSGIAEHIAHTRSPHVNGRIAPFDQWMEE